MPITQQRLLAILESAEDHEAAVRKASQIARRERDLALAGRQSAEEALANIALFLDDASQLLTRPVASATAIALERAHFTPTRVKDNERERARVARRRAAQVRRPPAEPQYSTDEPGDPFATDEAITKS